tara:strand:+ start:29215 stop:30345 length:1131 start_codon:yes stop_codon:yes gene_type:complete
MKKINSIVVVLAALFTMAACNVEKETSWSNAKSMTKALEWQEAHPINAIHPTDWTNGVYYLGVTKAHQATGDQKYIAALKEMGHKNDWKTCHRFFHADDLTISYSYLHINSTREHMVDLEPTDTFIQEHLYKDHPWREGKPMEGFEPLFKDCQVRLWWWCDALFMVPPVLAEYAKLKQDNSYLDEMHKYYKQTYDLLYDKEEHLFARDTRFIWNGNANDLKEENGQKIFWSRGNGWVFGGLALVLDAMPADYKHRAFYEQLYKEMAAKIKEIQHEDGLWRTSLLSPESWNHGEVSGTGLYTFGLTWGINNGLIDSATYKPAVTKAWTALKACQQEDGMVGWVQNIGASPEPASADSWQNYGTGAFLLAGSEILKLK